MLYSTKAYESQKKLSNWVRTGLDSQIDGAKQEGLKQYRRLFRNNIYSTMRQAFPIAFEILEEDNWNMLIDDFFAKNDSVTASIWKLPFEFYDFVEKNDYATKFDMEFLNDLLYFEWLEIEVFTMPNEYLEPHSNKGDLMRDKIEFNKEYRLVSIEYPVHLYAAKEAVKHKGEYFLLTYRTPDTYEVKFVNMPALHVLFFEYICNQEMNGTQIIEEIILQNPAVDSNQIEQNLSDFIESMMKEKVFLGYRDTYHN